MFKIKCYGLNTLREAAIAFDALFLLEHTAGDYTKREQDHTKHHTYRWVIVFYVSTTVGAMAPEQYIMRLACYTWRTASPWACSRPWCRWGRGKCWGRCLRGDNNPLCPRRSTYSGFRQGSCSPRGTFPDTCGTTRTSHHGAPLSSFLLYTHTTP